MTPLTVCCVWVKGAYPYTAEYVVRLERMVRRHLRRPFRFVCLTDQPNALPTAIDVVRIQPDAMVPEPTRGIWAKLEVFNPARAWNSLGRVLFLDLDVLVVADLDPIVDFPATFALTTDAFVEERTHLDTDRFNRKLVRKFNSSVMVWDGGPQTVCPLFTTWTPSDALRLSTDQDWIAEQSSDAQGMPLEWFPRISRVQPPWPSEAKVVLVKKPKNHEAVERWPWFEPMWGAA